nr:FAD-binding oxidoreductase [Patulibacter sp. SYSU D01012]
MAVDQRPAAVLMASGPGGVVEAIAYAREHGLRVAAQSTGHGAAPMGPLDRTLLVRTAGMSAVRVDPVARVAHVGAGVTWAQVQTALAPHGLAALAGTSATVGVAGYVLGGGVGWLARRHGLASSSLRAADVVTAAGERLRVDVASQPALLWALRGGGGSFALVTALELDLFPVSTVQGGVLFWPLDRAPEVLRAWRDWTTDLPDDLTSVGRLLRLPPAPELPEPLRGQDVVAVEIADLGAAEDADARVAPLRALAPFVDTFGPMPATALHDLHMDPPVAVPAAGDHLLLRDLPDEALDALVAAAGAGSGSPLLSAELRHLGGALARPVDGALDRIDAAYALYAVGMTGHPDATTAVASHLAALRTAMTPWSTGRELLTFSEQPTGPQNLFAPEAFRRLQAVKAAYDPDGLLRGNHDVVAAR